MRKIKEAYAVTGKYVSNGEQKSNFRTIGALFEKNDGTLSLKLDTIPAGNGWDGWVNFSDPKITKAKEAMAETKGPDDFDDSGSIPF